MTLIIYYVALMLVGNLAAIFFSLWVERSFPAISLTVFLFLYFAILWLAWPLAVRLTEPKKKAAESDDQPLVG